MTSAAGGLGVGLKVGVGTGGVGTGGVGGGGGPATPVGENVVKCENVAEALGASETVQPMAAPLSMLSTQRQVLGRTSHSRRVRVEPPDVLLLR